MAGRQGHNTGKPGKPGWQKTTSGAVAPTSAPARPAALRTPTPAHTDPFAAYKKHWETVSDAKQPDVETLPPADVSVSPAKPARPTTTPAPIETVNQPLPEPTGGPEPSGFSERFKAWRQRTFRPLTDSFKDQVVGTAMKAVGAGYLLGAGYAGQFIGDAIGIHVAGKPGLAAVGGVFLGAAIAVGTAIFVTNRRFNRANSKPSTRR